MDMRLIYIGVNQTLDKAVIDSPHSPLQSFKHIKTRRQSFYPRSVLPVKESLSKTSTMRCGVEGIR